MNAQQLTVVGERLVKRFGTRDPFQIATGLGISVKLCDRYNSLKGMYMVIKRNRFFFSTGIYLKELCA